MESEGSVDTQKAAYDAVDGKESIRESEIKMLIAQYGKLLGKERMISVAGNLANQLITGVGEETSDDFRHVTYEVYADRCGVMMPSDRCSTAGTTVWHPCGATGRQCCGRSGENAERTTTQATFAGCERGW